MEWGGINQELGVNTHTLLYIKQITNKDLTYSLGRGQFSNFVIMYNGKESEKNIYICMNV